MDGSANAYQAHNDPVDPGNDDGEEALDHDDDEENDTFSSHVALDDVTVFEAAELDAIAILADTWNDDLDPAVSAQLVQTRAQANLSFGKDKGKCKGKAKGKGKGRYPFRPSHRSLEDRRRRLKELKAQTECRACGRKGHWANDRECVMSSSSSSTQKQTRTARMATQQQLTNQAKQPGVCFVHNGYSDDPDTSAFLVCQSVPLSTEATEQIPLAPTASAAADIENTATFNDRAMDDNDVMWATEPHQRTGWNKTFKSGAYRGVLYGIALCDYPKQVVSLNKAKSVPTNMREFLSWA